MRIYFAHTFGLYKTEKEKEIISLLKECFGEDAEIINPFIWEESLTNRYIEGERTKTLAHAIVKKDLIAILECDVVFAYMEEPSVGVSMEIMFASMMAKEVYVVASFRYHPWIQRFAINYFKKLEEFKRYAYRARLKSFTHGYTRIEGI